MAPWEILTRRQIMLTFGGVMLAMFLASLDQTIVATAMPRIIADLYGFDRYTWVTTAYLLASTTVVPIVGRLSDIYGRKWFLTVGIIIFLIGSALSGLSQTMTQLIVLRGVQGIGGGVMMSIALVSIGDLFPPTERGKYQGILSGVFGLSSIIGPALGGFVTDTLSWHWVFYINLPLGIPVVFLFIRFFPHVRSSDQTHQIDYLGMMLLVLSVVPLLLALSWGGSQYPWMSVQVIGFIIFSMVMTVIFIAVESRVPEPIIPLSIFRNRIVSVSMVAIFFTGFAMFGTIIFVPLFFQGVLGASATNSGTFLTPMMLGVVFGAAVSGQALSRLGGHYHIQSVIGLVIMVAGMFLLTQMTPDTGYGSAVFSIVLLGVGLGSTFPLFTIAVQNAVDFKFMGVATSTTQFIRSVGGTMGLAVLGSIMANRFTATFAESVPTAVKDALPPGQLDVLGQNPQALVNPDTLGAVNNAFSQMGPEGAALAVQLLDAVRSALSGAITEVFMIGLVGTLIALAAVTAFLKEVPLEQGGHVLRSPGSEPEEDAAGEDI
ncbi:MAG: MFS transporter [SAR202 cluster bacterium]|nr:MFS transporter [SAR202 cluster bacterium]